MMKKQNNFALTRPNPTEVYKTKCGRLHGSKFSEVCKNAFGLYLIIKKKTKRRPYVRSDYFNGEKVFLELFWSHLHAKLNHRDKIRRARYFSCAIELIKHTRLTPVSKENVDRRSEILHRFAGITKDGELFFTQIKEEKRSGQKFLIS